MQPSNGAKHAALQLSGRQGGFGSPDVPHKICNRMNLDLFQLKQLIIECAELGARVAQRNDKPAEDEVCYSEVCKMVGSRRWVDYHIKAGNLSSHRRGTAVNSKKYFSRVEVLSLKQAEKLTTNKIYLK